LAILKKLKDAEEERITEAEDGHIVEKVLNWSKDEYGNIKYLLKWSGYD
jgi:hypothetical protein